ncbi:MAG: type II secretion system F family protein [Candidatus Micrarchaeota archaeon]
MSSLMDELGTVFQFLEPVFSDSSVEQMRSELKKANLLFKPRAYLSFSLGSALLLAFLFAILIFAFTSDSVLSLVLFLLLFALLFLALKRYPTRAKRSRAARLESDLPATLRAIGVELNMRTPFEQALRRACELDNSLSSEFQKIINEVESGGSSIPRALSAFAENVDSLLVKRSISQMATTYETGGSGASLKSLADEMIAVQRARASEFSSKLAFLGLLFIAVSCILPALFQAYLIVGSTFMDISFSPLDIWLLYLLAFPLANIAIIMMIRMQSPSYSNSSLPGFLSREENSQLTQILNSLGVKQNFRSLLATLALASFFLAVLLLFISLFIPLLFYFAFIAFAVPFLFYFYLHYKLENRKRELETFLPDALFHAASSQESVAVERMLHSIGESGYGELSREFAMASKQVEAGASVVSAMQEIAHRNNSPLLRRAITLLIQGYQTGANMHSALSETAEDIFKMFALVRERSAQLALQKYTLLFGGGIIVPIILGMFVNLVSGLGVENSEAILISSTPPEQRLALISASILASQVYLVIYSLLSSLFIAEQEGNIKKFVVYFAFLAPLVLILFSLARFGF